MLSASGSRREKFEYKNDSGSPAANLMETKLLFNSTISDAKDNAQFLSMDLKNVFLQTIMDDPEYMRVQMKYFPIDIQKRYNLQNIIHSNGYVYIKIIKGMYGLKQAAVLAYKKLSTLLKDAGYIPIVNTSGLWKQETRKTFFSLHVDDFGVKYYNKEDVMHLKNTIEKGYTVKINWEGNFFWDTHSIGAIKRDTAISACLTTYIKPYKNFNTFYKRTHSIYHTFVTKQIGQKRENNGTTCKRRPPHYFLWQIRNISNRQ